MHVHVEQQRRLTDVLHDGAVVLLSNKHTRSGVRLAAGRQHLQTDEPRRRRTHRVEPLQEDVVPQQDVGLHQVLVVGVDAGADAAVCGATGQEVRRSGGQAPPTEPRSPRPFRRSLTPAHPLLVVDVDDGAHQVTSLLPPLPQDVQSLTSIRLERERKENVKTEITTITTTK